MSSNFLTSDDMTMIERLLAEVREAGPEPSFDIETAQARLLVHAFEEGTAGEADLRNLLAEHVKRHGILARSHQRRTTEDDAPLHRQEHMLPSLEEEFNTARAIHPVAAASRSGMSVVAQNADGETALVHWLPAEATVECPGHWARLDTGEPFETVHWTQTSWTANEVPDHLSAGTSRMAPIHLDEHALEAGISAYLAVVGSYAPYRLDLHVASSEQVADGIAACIRAYLGAFPTDNLVARPRLHADAKIQNTLRYVVSADHLMLEAADRISMLEAELGDREAQQ